MNTLIGVVPVLFKRPDISFSDFSAYWRDIHGVYVASYAGPSNYRQLHFGQYDEAFWPDEALDRELAAHQVINGLAEFLFVSRQRCREWEAEVGPFADSDDGNLFRRSTAYTVSEHNVECFEKQPVRAGSEPGVRIVAFVKARYNRTGLAAYLREQFCPGIAESTGVTRVQLTVFDTYEVPDWVNANTGVGRTLTAQEQRDAVIEIVFSSEATKHHFFTRTYPSVAAEFGQYITHVNAYRVIGHYTLIKNGALTLAGMLGADRAALIDTISAKNITALLAKVNAGRGLEPIDERAAQAHQREQAL